MGGVSTTSTSTPEALGFKAIRRPSPLSARKYAYEHNYYCTSSAGRQHV
jgi:hypothetical protein